MNFYVELSQELEKQLVAYCNTYSITENQAIQRAIHQLLHHSNESTPYELGAEGFGADQTHVGAIAKNSKQILRNRFRDKTAC